MPVRCACVIAGAPGWTAPGWTTPPSRRHRRGDTFLTSLHALNCRSSEAQRDITLPCWPLSSPERAGRRTQDRSSADQQQRHAKRLASSLVDATALILVVELGEVAAAAGPRTEHLSNVHLGTARQPARQVRSPHRTTRDAEALQLLHYTERSVTRVVWFVPGVVGI